MTLRARRLLATTSIAASLAAGLTAEHWNPYAAQLAACDVERFEDGSAVITCNGVPRSIPNNPRTDAPYAP